MRKLGKKEKQVSNVLKALTKEDKKVSLSLVYSPMNICFQKRQVSQMDQYFLYSENKKFDAHTIALAQLYFSLVKVEILMKCKTISRQRKIKQYRKYQVKNNSF